MQSKISEVFSLDQEMTQIKNENEALLNKNTIIESQVNSYDDMVIKIEKHQQTSIHEDQQEKVKG